MDYSALLRRTYNLAPKGIQLGLDRVLRAAERLGSPHQKMTAVQIAGTNGKGSIACLLEHGAIQCDLKVGLFTSPHLHRFSERMKINGEEPTEALLAAHLDKVLALTQGTTAIPLTFFEVSLLTALSLFEQQQVDLAILEVGLGGRLDATSIVTPKVSIISSIGYDHIDLLGPTLRHIASEKAHIAQKNVPLILGPMQPDVLTEINRVANKKESPVFLYGTDFSLPDTITPPWPGEHQRQNTAVALAAFEQLQPHLPRLNRAGFLKALPTAFFPGRFETIQKGPCRFIIDGAHNVEATRALIDSLHQRQESPSILIFGALKGKPYDQMLGLLTPHIPTVYMAPPPIDRQFDCEQTAKKWQAETFDSAQSALKSAEQIGAGKTILTTGSFFIVAEVRRILLNETTDPPVGL